MAEIKTFKNKGEDGAIPLSASNLNETIQAILEILGLNIDNYSNEKTYTLEDIVVYNHKIYACIEEITTPEEFNDSKWEFVPLLVEEEEEDNNETI